MIYHHYLSTISQSKDIISDVFKIWTIWQHIRFVYCWENDTFVVKHGQCNVSLLQRKKMFEGCCGRDVLEYNCVRLSHHVVVCQPLNFIKWKWYLIQFRTHHIAFFTNSLRKIVHTLAGLTTNQSLIAIITVWTFLFMVFSFSIAMMAMWQTMHFSR